VGLGPKFRFQEAHADRHLDDLQVALESDEPRHHLPLFMALITFSVMSCLGLI
jgi:hypothetical protein